MNPGSSFWRLFSIISSTSFALSKLFLLLFGYSVSIAFNYCPTSEDQIIFCCIRDKQPQTSDVIASSSAYWRIFSTHSRQIFVKFWSITSANTPDIAYSSSSGIISIASDCPQLRSYSYYDSISSCITSKQFSQQCSIGCCLTLSSFTVNLTISASVPLRFILASSITLAKSSFVLTSISSPSSSMKTKPKDEGWFLNVLFISFWRAQTVRVILSKRKMCIQLPYLTLSISINKFNILK